MTECPVTQPDHEREIVQDSLWPEQYAPKVLRFRTKKLRALVLQLLTGERRAA